jgi:hypothetical protein
LISSNPNYLDCRIRSFHPSIRRQNNLHTFHRRVLEATMKDPQAKTRAHVHHGGQRIGLGRLHRTNLWLSKRRHHSLTSSGRGSHQIIHTTCRQVITIPIICPKAIQGTITQECHRIQ